MLLPRLISFSLVETRERFARRELTQGCEMFRDEHAYRKNSRIINTKTIKRLTKNETGVGTERGRLVLAGSVLGF